MSAAPSVSAVKRCDVLIAGCGVSGLYAALNLPHNLSVVMLAKKGVEECDSMLAQGGICVQRDASDAEAFFEDTMRVGHYENRPESVRIMVNESRSVIDDLLTLGVRFERNDDGTLHYTREAGHSCSRICHYEDLTGKEITQKLLAAVRALPNVTIYENTPLLDIVEEAGACVGAVVEKPKGGVLRIDASYVILATGGVGGVYERSTNYPSLTGDGCRIAHMHGVQLEHMDYVQIHPTSFYAGGKGRAFLISESCRGEGAVLLDARGNRFTDELAPRDVLTAAIYEQMAREGSRFVRLSFAAIDPERVKSRFPNIYQHCLDSGFDIAREPIPVAPAQHYLMGGIRVDADSRTSMPGLFAVGETSCNGVHGRNRLASNSLLESLVFARRAARAIGAAAGRRCSAGAERAAGKARFRKARI